MKVELAYPWTDDKGKTHDPDATVTIDDLVGKQLIRDGRARRSAGESKARAATPASKRPAKKAAAAKATPSKAPAPGADTQKEAGS